MKNKKLYLFVVVFLSLLSINCNTDETKNVYTEDTPTAGKITISVDETLKPIIETEIATFESIYVNAKINALYKPEADVMTDLLNGTSVLAIVPRKLNDVEKKSFQQEELRPTELKFAFDAVAVVTNKNKKLLELQVQELRDILSGKITKWNQIDPSLGSGEIKVIFDNKNSSLVNYSLTELIRADKFGNKNVFDASIDSIKDKENSEKVIDYVIKDPNALGLIGAGWISDNDDPKTLSFQKNLNVVAMIPDDTSKYKGDSYQPFQAYISLRQYPLFRDWYIISREARAGLGTGFSAFLSAEKGQRIVLKAGLVPANMPIRLIETKNQDIEIKRETK